MSCNCTHYLLKGRISKYVTSSIYVLCAMLTAYTTLNRQKSVLHMIRYINQNIQNIRDSWFELNLLPTSVYISEAYNIVRNVIGLMIGKFRREFCAIVFSISFLIIPVYSQDEMTSIRILTLFVNFSQFLNVTLCIQSI